MPDLKISLITVTFNAAATIQRCIESVIRQTYQNVEYIIIDGGSTDQTTSIVKNYNDRISHFISEPDKGIYDAMNKGIKIATGDVVGMLNADDVFSDSEVLTAIARAFELNDTNIVYGDLNYVKPGGGVLRKWRSGKYSRRRFNFGWMPPHPTFYCKRNLFEKLGYYSLDYGTAADYELMLRFMYRNKIAGFHINKILVKMATGGASNKSLGNRVKVLSYDLKAMRVNGIILPFSTIVLKPISKFYQFIN